MRYVPFVYMTTKSVPNAIYDGGEILVMQAQLGEWDNLNHLIICKSTGKAAIVDPFSGTYWMDVCERHGFSLESVLLTHSHWDHTKGVEAISKEAPNARIWVHELESLRGWEGPDTNRWNNPPMTCTDFKLGELMFNIHCTPGHTPGHVTICGNGIVVSGDCLFLGRCGRTDLFGGDVETQHDSLVYLKSVLTDLPRDWLVLPGHQYAMSDGRNPTFLTVDELLKENAALRAAGNWTEFRKLEFLTFDDSLADQARRQSAQKR